MYFRKLSKCFILLLLAGAVLTIVLSSNNAAQAEENATLLEVIENEDVEKYDTLLSLAITGGDYSWI